NGSERQERFCVSGGAIVDRWNRRPYFLESKDSGCDLLKPASCANLPPNHREEDRVDIGGKIQGPNDRKHQGRFRQEGVADAGARRDELHDVKTTILRR